MRPWMMVAILGSACTADRAPGPPRVAAPIVATLVGGPVRIDGSNFGARGSDHSVVLGATRISSTDASVTTWVDQTVIFNLPLDGLAIDGSTGDIWFAEYFAQRIGRLRLR